MTCEAGNHHSEIDSHTTHTGIDSNATHAETNDHAAHGLLLDYVRATVNLYGVISRDKLLEIYNKHQQMVDGEPATLDDLALLDFDAKNIHFYVADDRFVHVALDEDDLTLPNLEKTQTYKPWFIPQRDELLKFASPVYLDRPPVFLQLLAFVQREFGLDDERAEGLCSDIHLACMGARFSFDAVMYEFDRRKIKFADEKQLREAVGLIMELANNTRLWENRGYTPAEMRELPRKNVIMDKIGRNDPCPCGSGKKFKKCCGRDG